jgi:hypothetical protein
VRFASKLFFNDSNIKKGGILVFKSDIHFDKVNASIIILRASRAASSNMGL